MPSGAWADAFSRRRLLALSAVLTAAAFAGWVVLPSYPVFAAGFVLWGAGTALASGTLEALVYDELARRESTDGYATLMGRARAGGLAAILLASVVASPLVVVGGYLLVGVVSVATGLLTAALALTLPDPPRPVRPPEDAQGPEPGAGHATRDAVAAWSAMLRAGVSEAGRVPVVRRAVVAAALCTGLVSFDEYLPLLAADRGATPYLVAMLMAAVGVAEIVGAATAGRWPAGPARTRAVLLALAAVAVGVGALLPLLPGFVALALGYGVMQMLVVVLDARVQDAVVGDARATVTSVAGFGSEAVAIAVVAAVGLGSLWFALPVLLAALMVPFLVTAGVLAREDTGT